MDSPTMGLVMLTLVAAMVAVRLRVEGRVWGRQARSEGRADPEE